MDRTLSEIKKNYDNVCEKITFEDYMESLLALAVCKKMQPEAIRELRKFGFSLQKEKLSAIYNDCKKYTDKAIDGKPDEAKVDNSKADEAKASDDKANDDKANVSKESACGKKEELNVLKSLNYSRIQEVVRYQLHFLEEHYDPTIKECDNGSLSFTQKIRFIMAQMSGDFANSTANESEINLFTALVGDCKDLTVACPAAGMAVIVSKLKAQKYYLKEFSPHIFAFSAALLFLEDEAVDFIFEKGIFKKPTLKADIVVLSSSMGERFSLGVEKPKFPLLLKDKIPSSGKSSLWVQLALTHLNDTGKAYILLPSGWFFRGGYDAKVRNALLENDYVDAVIVLPQGILQKSKITHSMLILSKNREQGAPIRFVDASNAGLESVTSGSAILSPKICSQIASMARGEKNDPECPAAGPGEEAAGPGEEAAGPGEETAGPGEETAAPGEETVAIYCTTKYVSELQNSSAGEKAVLAVSHFIKQTVTTKQANLEAEEGKLEEAHKEFVRTQADLIEALDLAKPVSLK